jgi:hypothetical protein
MESVSSPMQRCYGMVSTDDGFYVMASLQKKKSGKYGCSIRKWKIHNRIRTYSLLQKKISFGMSSLWQQGSTVVAESKFESFVKGNAVFKPVAEKKDYDIHINLLKNNISSAFPDNAFLCSLPLFLSNSKHESFISVYCTDTIYSIGIVVDRKLSAVFNMPCREYSSLEYHLVRIKRYLENIYSGFVIPRHVFVMGQDSGYVCDGFSIHYLQIMIGGRRFVDYPEIKAIGCALAVDYGIIPVFPVRQPDSVSRNIKYLLTIAASVIVVSTVFFTCGTSALAYIAKTRLHKLETRYGSSVMNNAGIKEIMNKNDSIARQILRMQSGLSVKTHWGHLLEIIGKNRPEGLFYEKLGSEPVPGHPERMRIAISGSAKNQSLVADLIASLQKDRMFSGISLSYMEKNGKKNDICDFRIICSVNISGM